MLLKVLNKHCPNILILQRHFNLIILGTFLQDAISSNQHEIWTQYSQSTQVFCYDFSKSYIMFFQIYLGFSGSLSAFEIRPFRLSKTTKTCGGQSIVSMRLSARTTNFCEGYSHITLLFKDIYKSSDCHG